MLNISSITPYLPNIASPKQIVKNVSNLAITAAALCVLSNLSIAYAGHCEDKKRLCVMTCMSIGGGETGVNPAFGVSACLVGCDLAYWACLAMGR